MRRLFFGLFVTDLFLALTCISFAVGELIGHAWLSLDTPYKQSVQIARQPPQGELIARRW